MNPKFSTSFGGLPGKPLSPKVRARVEEFIESTNKPEVREKLKLTGLEDHRISYMKARPTLLLLNGFPK